MTRDDALTVVGLLNAAFPNEALEEPTVALWLSLLMEMADAEAATNAALAIVKSGQRFPSIADFRQIYRVHVELEPKAALPAASVAATDIPEWVLVWRWARQEREPTIMAPFPQQHPHHQPPYLTEREYHALREEWVAAGSPRFTLSVGGLLPRELAEA
jgi:hypothetical protein